MAKFIDYDEAPRPKGRNGNPAPVTFPDFRDDAEAQSYESQYAGQNKAELAREMSRTKDPKRKAVLLEEYRGNVPAASKFVDYEPPESTTYELGSDVGNFFAGTKKGVVDMSLGIKQRLDEGANYLEQKFGGEDLSRALGMRPAKEILPETDARIVQRRDYYKPLMGTKAGIAGDVTGNVLAAVPAAFIPGAATVPGAVAIGAGQGFFQPVANNESVAKNTMVGGLLGGIIPGAVQGARVAKSLLYDPFTKKGNEEIARMTLKNFGITPKSVAEIETKQTITGARPTLAEQITDPTAATGAARLQDALAVTNPQKFGARAMDNNAARVNALENLAGEGGPYTKALGAREAATQGLYDKALARTVSVSDDPQWAELSRLPAVRDVLKTARTNLENQGLDISNPANTMRALDNAKKLLDTKIRDAQGVGGKAASPGELEGLRAAKTKLLEFMETQAPEYGTARTTFAELSRPVNQMNVAREVLKRGTSATTDLEGNARLMPDGLLRTLRDEPGLIKRATQGKAPQQELGMLLEPDQLKMLNAVAEETNRVAAVGRAGAGPGSATAQRLASQNVLNKAGGLLGMTKLQNNPYAQTIVKPLSYLYDNVAEPRIQATLTEIVLNPGRAKEIMAGLSPADRGIVQNLLQNKLTQQAIRNTLPASATGNR
jgi:hypothetical protein